MGRAAQHLRPLGKKLARSIIHEDTLLVAINKWRGLVCQGASKSLAVDPALVMLKRRGGDEPPRLVHRLDRGTTGVLLFGRGAAAAAAASAAFRERSVGKEYLAVVLGVPPALPAGGEAVELRSWLPEAAGDKRAWHAVVDGEAGAVVGGGLAPWDGVVLAEAERRRGGMTLMRSTASLLAVAPDGAAALLRLALLTGVTHQLRVQCSALGTPILGDGRYGPGLTNRVRARLRQPGEGLERDAPMLLHAHRLLVPSLAEGHRPARIVAPVPDDFSAICAALRLPLK